MVMLRNFWLYHLRRRLLLLVFLLAGLVGFLLAAVWMLACILFAPYGPRPMHIAIGFDQLVNAATGGSEDETISSRAGRLRREGRGWACVLCWVLDKLETGHCERSIGS
ncbi:MAG: hypothetical protein M0Q22_15925 [Sulfuritalea sp.]|jgi:hypothetical protein|nr:hypothetical protein [Sulfuritalea sp.]